MGMLLQTTCIIINPVLNVATKNVENDVLKKLKEKDKDDEKTLRRKMVQDSFIEQSYSSHKANGKQKFRPNF